MLKGLEKPVCVRPPEFEEWVEYWDSVPEYTSYLNMFFHELPLSRPNRQKRLEFHEDAQILADFTLKIPTKPNSVVILSEIPLHGHDLSSNMRMGWYTPFTRVEEPTYGLIRRTVISTTHHSFGYHVPVVHSYGYGYGYYGSYYYSGYRYQYGAKAPSWTRTFRAAGKAIRKRLS